MDIAQGTRVLITGATGFVGANLVEAAAQRGWQPVALHRPASSLKALQGLAYESAIGDVMDPASLAAAMRGVDLVFHVAAVADYWRTGPQRMYQVNVDGTRHVLAAARAAGVRRVVMTSSAAALGRPPYGQPVNESAPFNLKPEQFHYGYTKVLAEQVAGEFAAAGLEVVIVNPAVIIGPRDVNLISGSMIVEAGRIGFPFYPLGGVCVIDVADVCAAEIAAAERGRPGERYILGGDNLWYRDMLNVICDAVGRRRPAVPLPRALTPALAGVVDAGRRGLRLKLPLDGAQVRFSADTFWFDSTKARRELGLATRPFAESVRRTVEWYRANGYL